MSPQLESRTAQPASVQRGAPKHALYVAWGYPPAKSGGVFRMLETANALVELGWKVTVVACGIDDLRRYAGCDLTTLEGIDPAIDVVRVPFDLGPAETDLHKWDVERVTDPDGWRRSYADKLQGAFPNGTYGLWEEPLLRAVDEIHAARPVDVTIASGGPFVCFSAGRHLRDSHGVPYVLDYRDSWSLQQFTDERIFGPGSAVAKVESELIAKASQVWFVNDAMREWHENVYPALTVKSRVVTNGYDPLPLEDLHVPSDRADHIRFTFLGTVTLSIPMRECLDGYVRAREENVHVSTSTLEFHGYLGFYPTPNKELANEIERVSDNGVSYCGPVPKSAVSQVYEQSDVLVLTFGGSKYITSGKVFEYMATGRPIVSVHGPDSAVRDVLADYPMWFPTRSLDTEDVAAVFIEAATFVAEGRAHAEETVTAARRHAETFERRSVLREAMADLDDTISGSRAMKGRLAERGVDVALDVTVYEVPLPSTRTIRMMDTLRGAGVVTKAIHGGAQEDAVRGFGFQSMPFANRKYSLLAHVEKGLKDLQLAEPGTADGRVRELYHAMREVPVPSTRPIWLDTKLLSQDWYDVAHMMVEEPTPLFWAADLDALPPAIWAKRAVPGTRVILDAHELFMELDYLEPTQRSEWEEIAKTFLPEVDLVITVGQGIADELVSRYGVKRVEVIESLSVPTRFPGTDVRSAAGLDEDIPLVVHVGNVSNNRNPLLAIDLLKSDPDLHFAFVGRVGGGLADVLADAAEERSVTDRLHFVGSVPIGELQHFLSTADASAILYSPKTSENLRLAMPNKLFDSLGSGVPCVATAGTAAADYLEKEGLGLGFVYGDAASLAQALRSIMGDDGYGRRALERAADSLWPTIEPKLLDLIAEELAAASVPELRRAQGPRVRAKRSPQPSTDGAKRRKPRYSWRENPKARARMALAWRLRKLAIKLEP